MGEVGDGDVPVVTLVTAGLASLGATCYGATTIFSDGFEGTFPRSWTAGNNGGTTTAEWGNNTARYTAGSWSAFCPDNGSNTRTLYDNNLHAYMQRQSVSLAGYTTATLTSKHCINAESGWDFFNAFVRGQADNWSAPRP
ncbi:MAG TPA: hypothetical protein PLU30_16785 [Verrucomicrobiae bacterium]|nr:hypothetical protein [Verrucomicrobiae bacterium]